MKLYLSQSDRAYQESHKGNDIESNISTFSQFTKYHSPKYIYIS